MNARLPSLTIGLLLAGLPLTYAQNPPRPQQVPAVLPAEPTPIGANAGEAFLDRVRQEVDGLPTLSAKVRQMVDLGHGRLVGTGLYLQRGRGPTRAMRWELEFQTSTQPCRREQISDGANLWLFEQLAGESELTWVDMLRLARARPKSPPPSPLAPWDMIGGVPRLLSGLQSAFRFGAVTEARLEDVRARSTEGVWEPSRLAQLLPDQQAAINAGQAVDLTKLAPNLPDRVVVYAGYDDFIPFRVEYWRGGTPGKPAGDDNGKLIALLEFYEVSVSTQIDPQQFVCRHGDLKPVDRTLEYLEKLGLAETIPVGASRATLRRR